MKIPSKPVYLVNAKTFLRSNNVSQRTVGKLFDAIEHKYGIDSEHPMFMSAATAEEEALAVLYAHAEATVVADATTLELRQMWGLFVELRRRDHALKKAAYVVYFSDAGEQLYE